MSTDHHRPRLHLRPPTGYVNDPNGPVFRDGLWQLFFQYVADTARTGPVVWGHASSADLVRWRLHRPAMGPAPEGPDRDGCWSGNVVEHAGELIAFYSAYRREHPYQSVVLARSVDNGRSFGPPQLAVADPEPDEGITTFRDPFVWRDPDRWRMLVGAGGASGRASARLYESSDLQAWHYAGPLAERARRAGDDPDTGQMWECPQLISGDEQDALLVSACTDRGALEVLALTGRRNRGRLIDPQVHRYDYGGNFYAASVLRHSAGGATVWGWITEGRTAQWAVEADWSGAISLPRHVSITADGQLVNAPAPALTSLRQEPICPSTVAGEQRFAGLPGQFELELRLSARAADHGPTRITLRCGPEEHLDLTVDRRTGRITVDRDAASADPRADRGVFAWTEPIPPAGELTLRWFIDGSISELFTGSGRCATVRFYPTTPPPWTISLAGRDGTGSVTVWPLHSCAP